MWPFTEKTSGSPRPTPASVATPRALLVAPPKCNPPGRVVIYSTDEIPVGHFDTCGTVIVGIPNGFEFSRIITRPEGFATVELVQRGISTEWQCDFYPNNKKILVLNGEIESPAPRI